MSRQRPSSNRVSSFRLTLEVLEDRIVPSAFGDLLNSFVTTISQNIKQSAVPAIKAVGNDVQNYNSSHDLGNFLALAVDAINLETLALQVNQQVTALSFFVKFAEAAGQVSGAEATALDDRVETEQSSASAITSAANQAIAAVVAIATTGQGTTLPPLASNASIISFQVPASVAGGSGSVTAQANINAGFFGAKVTLSVSGTDDTSATKTEVIDQGTDVISLTVPVGPSGHTYTWTVSIEGGGLSKAHDRISLTEARIAAKHHSSGLRAIT